MAKKTMAKSNGKAAASSKPKKLGAAGKVRTKGEFFSTLAEQNMLTRKQVAGVFESMSQLIAADLGKSGPGVVNVGGLMKVTVVRKPATKEREGINPFTKEKITIKAKPARNVIKVRPLKSLKGLV